MRYMGYIRQSNTKEGSESLATQRAAITDTAERFGVELVGFFEEPPSTGAYRDRGRRRKEFAQLLTELASGHIDGVIAYKTDRLSRGGGVGWAPLFEAAEAGGLNLDKFVLTPNGFVSEFELGIRATMDREESKKTGDRVRNVRALNAKAGKLNPGGHRPFGYERDGSIHQREADAIRAGVDHLLGGGSLYALAQQWNGNDLLTTDGNQWTGPRICKTLTNPRLHGVRTYKGEVVAEGAWPTIITTEQGDRLRLMMKSHRNTNTKAFRRSYLLTGFLVCGRCGAKLVAQRRTDGTPSYMCMRMPGSAGCNQLRVVATPLDELVTGEVLGALQSAKTIKALRADTKRQHADANALYKALETDQRQLEEIAAMVGNNDITPAEWKIAREPINKRIETTKAKLARMEQSAVNVNVDDLKAMGEQWDDLTLEQKRTVIGALVDHVTIAPAQKRGERFNAARVSIAWLR